MAREAIRRIDAVATYGLHDSLWTEHSVVLARELRLQWRPIFFSSLFGGLATSIMILSESITFWYGGRMMEAGRIANLKILLRTLFGLVVAAMSLFVAAIDATDSEEASRGAARAFSIIDAPPPPPCTGARVSAPQSVRFHHARFEYPARPSAAVLRDITFLTGSNDATAVIGGSGRGRSSLVWLLHRFHDVTGGAVAVNELDLRDLCCRSVRAHFGVILGDETAIFHASVQDNIRFGRVSASRSEVISAAQKAKAHDFIMALPNGV
eukprot:Polyplicarium_translucidae@DN2190_c2_g1_i2.p1